MLISGLCSTSDDWSSDPSNESHQKCKKWLPNCQKMKCSFLDYVQLLMISQVIQVIQMMKVTQNVKKMATKLSKNEMLIFGFFYGKSPEMRKNGHQIVKK